MLFSLLRPNTYQDSLRLMRVSRALAEIAGVDRVSLVMGTPANKDMLRSAGLDADSVDAAGPADLIVAADVADAETADLVVARAEELLASGVPSPPGPDCPRRVLWTGRWPFSAARTSGSSPSPASTRPRRWAGSWTGRCTRSSSATT